MVHNTKRNLNFNYTIYNIILTYKFVEVVAKKFIKYILLSRDIQKRRFFLEKLGLFNTIKAKNSDKKWIWIHANAVGEVNACQHLLRLIRNGYPNNRILLTTSNFTADARATQLNIADVVLFFPYDIPVIINKFLSVFKLTCVIILECDLWPNFVKICRDRKIPVFIASGIFNNNGGRSLGIRYLYNYKFLLTNEVLNKVDYFCMQTEDDKNRLSEVLDSNHNIIVTGNLKLNGTSKAETLLRKDYYRRLINIHGDESVFVAGNIHKEEFPAIIDAFILIKQRFSSAVMIVAPRFLEEVSQLKFLLSQKNIDFFLRTQLDGCSLNKKGVIILDTMGELARVYILADVAFVGGSLVYLSEAFGGHNILEAAMVGVPVMFGPYMHNFRSLADLFLRRHAAIEVKNSAELADVTVKLWSDRNQSKKIIENALAILDEHKDVSNKTLLCLNERIKNAKNY